MALFLRYWLWLPFLICLSPDLRAQLSHHDQKAKARVIFPSGASSLPREWLKKQVNPEITPVSADEKGRIEELLTRAFGKYPPELINKNLAQVFVFKSMKFYGLPYGGTNYHSTVFLSDDSENPLFTNEYIEQVFHHEFSSILIRNYPEYFDKTKWLLLNPPGFKYGKGGADAISQGTASMDLDPSLIIQGFLSEYSTASLEEDINVLVQNLFTGGREFWSELELNDAIREKTRILISFYHRINPVFTESYFRGFYYNSTAQR